MSKKWDYSADGIQPTWLNYSKEQLDEAIESSKYFNVRFNHGSIWPEEWIFLRNLASEQTCNRILEIGVYKHTSSTAFLRALETHPTRSLLSCDVRYLRPDFKHPKLRWVNRRWTKVTESSHTLLPRLANQLQKYDLIFIDGDHSESSIIADIKNSCKIISSNGRIVVHDVNCAGVAKTVIKTLPIKRELTYYPFRDYHIKGMFLLKNCQQ